MVPVIEEDVAEYPPHVIDPVGVEELHGPALTLRRETAEHEYARPFRKERGERMRFDRRFTVHLIANVL